MLQSKQLDLLLTNNNSSDKKVYIKYYLEKSLRPNHIYELIEDLFHLENVLNNNDDLFIIIKDEPNDTLIKEIKLIWEKNNIYITIINIKRLQFNILNHFLVPKHTILTDEQATQFKKKYNISNNKQIPDISRFSPVSQVLGIRPGQICKIQRISKTAITSEFYRVCSV